MPRNKVTTVKKRVDKWFSIFIRLRDAAILNQQGYVQCCSCGYVDYWKNMDAGHWINRRHNSTRYEETNVHAQCRKCNRFDEGNASGYARFMLASYGSEHMDDLDELHYRIKQFKTGELLTLEAKYKKKAKALADKLGVTT